MAKKEIVETRWGLDFYLNKFGEKCADAKCAYSVPRSYIYGHLPKKFKYIVQYSDGVYFAYTKKPSFKQHPVFGLTWALPEVQNFNDAPFTIEIQFESEDYGWQARSGGWVTGYAKIED